MTGFGIECLGSHDPIKRKMNKILTSRHQKLSRILSPKAISTALSGIDIAAREQGRFLLLDWFLFLYKGLEDEAQWLKIDRGKRKASRNPLSEYL
jgi:hypothetical protein